MNNPNFNQGLHDSFLQSLKDSGVPENIAEQAAAVVASDDALLPDLGRTPEDQLIVNEALNYYQNHQQTNI